MPVAAARGSDLVASAVGGQGAPLLLLLVAQVPIKQLSAAGVVTALQSRHPHHPASSGGTLHGTQHQKNNEALVCQQGDSITHMGWGACCDEAQQGHSCICQ
jgi:hypothetical protein